MMKIAFVVAAAVLTTAPLATPAKAQGVKMAQVDMQTGLHIDDPANYSRDRRRYDSNAAVGVGPRNRRVSPLLVRMMPSPHGRLRGSATARRRLARERPRAWRLAAPE